MALTILQGVSDELGHLIISAFTGLFNYILFKNITKQLKKTSWCFQFLALQVFVRLLPKIFAENSMSRLGRNSQLLCQFSSWVNFGRWVALDHSLGTLDVFPISSAFFGPSFRFILMAPSFFVTLDMVLNRRFWNIKKFLYFPHRFAFFMELNDRGSHFCHFCL